MPSKMTCGRYARRYRYFTRSIRCRTSTQAVEDNRGAALLPWTWTVIGHTLEQAHRKMVSERPTKHLT